MSNHTLIALLDRVDRHPGQVALRARSYELLGLAAGSRVADVGCGAGPAVAEMAALGAEPIGLDADGQVIEVARSRHPGLEFRRADACDLPFGDGELAVTGPTRSTMPWPIRRGRRPRHGGCSPRAGGSCWWGRTGTRS